MPQNSCYLPRCLPLRTVFPSKDILRPGQPSTRQSLDSMQRIVFEWSQHRPSLFAFLVPGGAGADVQLSVSGLNIYGFASAINLSGGGQHKVTGNDFTPSAGSAPNSVNVRVSGTASVVLGGSEADKRNLLVGATDASVVLDSNQNIVIGNVIGPGRGGTYSIGAANKVGVRVMSGGLNSIFGNTISGNIDYGVELVNSSHDSYLESNLVGENDGGACLGVCDQDHPPSLPNGKAGFRIDASSSKNWIFSNEVAYNPVGVCIGSTRNAMTNNRIHDNATLGVDLDGTGGVQCQGLVDQNDNDTSTPPAYPNGGQNYPVLLWSGG